MHAPANPQEAARLAALNELDLLRAPPLPLLQQLVDLAASVCGMPQALVSLIDSRQQWYLACHGLQGEGLRREASVCECLLVGPPELVVEDLLAEPAFASHPLRQMATPPRFYAGVALVLPGGERIGSLCVFDASPRQLSEPQRTHLRSLAAAVVQALLLQAAQQRQHHQLQASEQRFRALAELSPVGVFHTDATGACTYTNPAWQRIYGMGLEASLGSGWSRGLHPDDAAQVVDEWQRTASQGLPFQMEFRVQPGDGGPRREVRAATNPQRDATGLLLGHVGVVEDVSESRRQQRELRLRELQLDAAARLAGVGAWRVELEPAPEVHWSAQTARIHERPADYQPGLDEALDYYPPAVRDTMAKTFQRTAEGGPGFDLVMPLVTAGGRSRWVRTLGEGWQEAGRTVRVFGAFQDITEQRERELALAASNQHLRQIHEQTPALLATLDAQGGLHSASNALLQRLGRSRAELARGLSAICWLEPESAQRLQQHWLPRLRTDGRLDAVPCQLRAATVQQEPIHALLTAVRAPGDDSLALVHLEDVSAQLRADRELQREQQLRQALQTALDERSEMLDVLAHEVRQPLHNAAVALEAAQASSLPPGVARAIGRARAVLGGVRAGVDNTLVAAQLLARHELPPRDEIELPLLLQIVAGDLPEDTRPRLLGLERAPQRTLRLDASLTRLALRNLLLNALRYSEGSVALQFSESESPARFHIDVQDQGPGFPTAVLARLFERGARGGERGSHGLGLHIAHRALLLQGGELRLLHSGPGGAALRLSLPDE